MHLEVDQKYYLHQKKRDGLVHPVLDSLDNYKILSERMNVLTIYLPRRKLPVASNLRIVKTAVIKNGLMYLTAEQDGLLCRTRLIKDHINKNSVGTIAVGTPHCSGKRWDTQ